MILKRATFPLPPAAFIDVGSLEYRVLLENVGIR